MSEQEGVYSENINSDHDHGGRKDGNTSNDNVSIESRLSNRRKIMHIERSKQQTPKVQEAEGDKQNPVSTRGSMPIVKQSIRDDPLNEKNLILNSIIQSIKENCKKLKSSKFMKATGDD